MISQSLRTTNNQSVVRRVIALSTYHVVGLCYGRIHDQSISHNNKLSVIKRMVLALSTYHVVGLCYGRIHDHLISHNNKLSVYCAHSVRFINLPCCRLV